MQSLRQDFDDLTTLNHYRSRAVTLRNKGYYGLMALEDLKMEKGHRLASVVSREILPREKQPGALDKWLGMGNKIEAALLLRVQRDRRLRRQAGKTFPEADAKLAGKIEELTIGDLLPFEDEGSDSGENEFHANAMLDRRIPVLLAANAMQVLTGRSSTALSQQTMYCYYAILHELNLAMRPDWTIGATRAGNGGNVSAFVTGECMHAILSLETVHRRTADFMRFTSDLNEKYLHLRNLVASIGGPLAADHPLQRWIEKASERMWLDWYASVDAQRGELCLEVPDVVLDRPPFEVVKAYLKALPGALKAGIDKIVEEMKFAAGRIDAYAGTSAMNQPSGNVRRSKRSAARPQQQWNDRSKGKERAREYAHESAVLVIHDARIQGEALGETINKFLSGPHDDDNHVALLKKLEEQFTKIAISIRRVLDPSKHYVEGALDRALAESESQLDAGDLVFAACAYGSVTRWQSSSRHLLGRACELLLKSVPENGTLGTRRPFHSTSRGYKLYPTSCEMMSGLALLVQRTSLDLDAAAIRAVGRLLDSIDDKKIDLDNDKWYGWNFDGATEQDKPSVWVSCVAVLSLDRLVLMLDRCINATVFRHFDVKQPVKPDNDITLNDLIYPDYGFALECPLFGHDTRRQRTPIAITLEEMRAHLLRVPLPDAAARAKAFSAVLYGPPQTGKTTFAEALARSGEVPVVRLSAFDLTQDPQESIESRARVIFDALSMITHAVILFDEFESVLQERDEKHELTIEFLLTGLLPKLVKLHNVGGSQGLVYFLATNHVERIDSAAIRRGRFDLQVPVYNPDVLSRAAACLYRLQIFRHRAKKWDGKEQVKWTSDQWSLDSAVVIRLLTIVAATKGVSPRDLTETFFRLPGDKLYDLHETQWSDDFPYFAHILEGRDLGELNQQPDDEKKKEKPPAAEEGVEWLEQNWLERFEQSFDDKLTDAMKRLAGKSGKAGAPATILESCLRAPSASMQ